MEIRFNSKSVDYSWLSNFSPHPVRDSRGRVWPTAEHMYQACKSPIEAEQELILQAKTPHEAKRLGRTITLREGWEEFKTEAMRRVLALKFRQHPDLEKQLVATHPARLIHEAPWDGFWGSGRDGRGLNRQGELLEELREKLRPSLEELDRLILRSPHLPVVPGEDF